MSEAISHLLTHCLTHSFTLTHSLAHSLTHSFTRSLTHHVFTTHSQFLEHWAEYDPLGTRRIPVSSLKAFIHGVAKPFGFGGDCVYEDELLSKTERVLFKAQRKSVNASSLLMSAFSGSQNSLLSSTHFLDRSEIQSGEVQGPDSERANISELKKVKKLKLLDVLLALIADAINHKIITKHSENARSEGESYFQESGGVGLVTGCQLKTAVETGGTGAGSIFSLEIVDGKDSLTVAALAAKRRQTSVRVQLKERVHALWDDYAPLQLKTAAKFFSRRL